MSVRNGIANWPLTRTGSDSDKPLPTWPRFAFRCRSELGVGMIRRLVHPAHQVTVLDYRPVPQPLGRRLLRCYL